jgi:hypothetical protein
MSKITKEKQKDKILNELTLVDVIKRFGDMKSNDIGSTDLRTEIATILFGELQDVEELKVTEVWSAAEYIVQQLNKKYLMINKEKYSK